MIVLEQIFKGGNFTIRFNRMLKFIHFATFVKFKSFEYMYEYA